MTYQCKVHVEGKSVVEKCAQIIEVDAEDSGATWGWGCWVGSQSVDQCFQMLVLRAHCPSLYFSIGIGADTLSTIIR